MLETSNALDTIIKYLKIFKRCKNSKDETMGNQQET